MRVAVEKVSARNDFLLHELSEPFADDGPSAAVGRARQGAVVVGREAVTCRVLIAVDVQRDDEVGLGGVGKAGAVVITEGTVRASRQKRLRAGG